MRRALLVGLLAAALAPLAARAQTITAAPGGEMTSLVGLPFDVPIYLDMTARAEKVGAFAARVQWNPAVLQVSGSAAGTFGGVTVNPDSLAAGVAQISGANPAGAGGLITLAVLHFTPLVPQADTLRLAVRQLFAAGTFADLSPSLTTRNGYYCPARGMFGDIDKDGAINSRDALIALSNAVGLDVSAFDVTLGDVDASGATNARDALIILSSAVGLPVASFRVGRLAGGACASSLPLVMAIIPDTVDLVVGQTVAFEVRAADSSGALQTVTAATWKSSNTGLLAVAPDGTALAHDTGTVRVTAIRTALDSAQALVHIVAHRTRDIVDAAALGAKNQLGSAAFPFASIGQGIAFAQSGDTVEVRAGRYPEVVLLDRAAVLIGDTLADGTRPLIAGTDTSSVGVQLSGFGTRIVRDLAIDAFYEGVDVAGPAAVVLHGLRMTNVATGVYVDQGPVGSLRLEASRLVGTTVNGNGDGITADTPTPVDTLVVQNDEISDFGWDGVYGVGADSLAVLGSRIHDVGEYGIEGGSNYCSDCAPPQRAIGRGPPQLLPSQGFVMDSSAVLNAGYEGVYLDGVRSSLIARSVIRNSYTAVEVYGLPGGWARFLRDSVVQSAASEGYWLYAASLDSLTADSMSAQIYGEGYVYTVPLVRVTRSQFSGVQATALYVGGPTGNGVVTLDSVSVTGNPSCDLCGSGFSFGNERVSANRLAMANLNEPIYAYGNDSSMTVTNSSFSHVNTAITWYASGADSTSRLTVKHSTFVDFDSYAILAEYGGLRVDSSTFQNGGNEGVYWYDATAPGRVLGNTFASVPSPIDLEPGPTSAVWVDTVANNTLTDVSYEGMVIYADDSVPFRISGNSVTCNGTGGVEGSGIDLEYASGAVTGNQVNGCEYGVYLYDDGSTSNPRRDSVLGNLVSTPAASGAGIYVEGTIKSRIAGNSVTGDTAGGSSYGDVYVYGYQPGATAAIDSNTIVGGSNAGVYVAYLDTALVRWNAVRGVNAPSLGGVATDGNLTYLARIYGNSVHSVVGNGIRIYNADTAMVQVDSNLVDSSAADGIQLDGGADSVVHNGVAHSGVAGVLVSSNSVNLSRSVVDSNSIVGNSYGLQANVEGRVQAQYNWWGDPLGPQCTQHHPDGSDYCDVESLGDSVSYGSLTFIPFAESAFGNTPSPAAPARPAIALRPPAAARAVGASEPVGPGTPVTRKPRAVPAASFAVAPAPRAPAALGAPPHLTGARAQSWQQLAARRTQALAAAGQRRAAIAAAQAQVAATRAAAEQRHEQRRADLEAKRKARQARQAARAAAATHGVRQ